MTAITRHNGFQIAAMMVTAPYNAIAPSRVAMQMSSRRLPVRGSLTTRFGSRPAAVVQALLQAPGDEAALIERKPSGDGHSVLFLTSWQMSLILSFASGGWGNQRLRSSVGERLTSGGG